LILLLFLGCEKKDFTKEPPVMHWDRDMCERCKMAISERKFAVVAVDGKNRVYKFDDIGCLVLWQKNERPDIKFKKIWIKDAKSAEWIDANSACYKKEFLTPMGYGYGALKSAKGECLRLEDIKEEIK
jgi:copper chaperone NosL